MGIPRSDSVGRYELLMELAKGGMAELFLGRLHGVGGFAKLVAIKRILPHLAADKLFVEMFLNEGRIASHLAHPNVCQVHELGESDGDLFLAMEYLEGVSWDALAKDLPRDADALRLAAGVIVQACDGLHYAHELRDIEGTPTPVIHRDVSPQNLFVTTSGVCKVLDFGVSKMVKDGPRTRTGVLKGKLPYMSPEQIQGEPVDARSDVWALGVVTWEALAGESLFDRDTDFLIWKAITEDAVPRLAERGFPPELDEVLASALSRDRAQRFSSARAFGQALRTVAERVGGARAPAEIAAIVKARCGDALAARAAEVASVVTSRRSRPPGPPPVEADAGATLAGETMSLRADTARPARTDARNRWPLIAGVLAVVASVAVVAAVTRTGNEAPAPVAAPPPSEAPGSAAASVPEDAWAKEAARGIAEGTRQLEQVAELAERLAGAAPPSRDQSERPPKLRDSLDRVNKGLEKLGRKVESVKPVSEPALDPDAARGTLSIDSSPYATIYLDGHRLGDTPLWKLSVAPGKHQVRAVLADGREKTFPITVAPGEDVRAGKLAW